MSEDTLAPRRSLRARVIGFFVLAAIPAVALSAAAVVALDRLVAQEIRSRVTETTKEAERILADESTRIRAALDALAEDEELALLAGQVETFDPRSFEALAGRLAPTHGLDLLAISVLRGPEAGTIVSSAHLPAAVGDDVDPFVPRLQRAPSSPPGLAYVLVEGNPPRPVPGLVAGRVVKRHGQPALIVYGGARLDGHRLAHVARAGQATFVLSARGHRAVTFPEDARRPKQSPRVAPLPLAAVGVPAGKRAKGATPGQLEIYVDTARLENARSVVRTAAVSLGALSLFAALLAGAFLSRRLTRPVVELSEAARRVGAGELDVHLEPRSDDEVGSLVRVFNRMTQEIAEGREHLARAERVAAWQQIARRVAHEIKNPLFPIQMSMETLRKSYARQHPKLDEIMEESTTTVLEEVKALNRIVTEFSDFARLPTPQRAPESARGLLAHVHGLYKSQPEGGTEVVIVDGEDATLDLDKGQIARALINLVKNALEAHPEGGRVELRVAAESVDGRAGAWLEVADDGPGMSPEVRAQIFTPYFTTKETGTGLGLAIVDRIASEHDGQVRIDSEVGRGTTIRMWLPAAAAGDG